MVSAMTYDQLVAFLAVTAEGTFTAAKKSPIASVGAPARASGTATIGVPNTMEPMRERTTRGNVGASSRVHRRAQQRRRVTRPR